MNTKETDLAWATGLFEGEGCIFVGERKCRGYTYQECNLQLQMTDEDTVNRFAKIVGHGNVRFAPINKHNKKPLWRWGVSKKVEVRRILNDMLPLLSIRRAHKALDALDLIECTT